MSKKKKNDFVLSPEEDAAIDRILRGSAEADNAEVDFDAMHDAIIKKARNEGIAVFSKPAKKQQKLRRILFGTVSAAAALAVGFAIFTVIRSNFDFSGKWNFGANDNKNPREQTASAPTNAPGGDDVIDAPSPRPTEGFVISTIGPVDPAETTPVPTAVPVEIETRGSWIGYTIMLPFTEAPYESTDLIPALLPEFMLTKPSPNELFVTSYGKDETGDEMRFSCSVSQNEDRALGVGAARYTVSKNGSVRFLWRVTEDCWIEASFEGFIFEDACDILLTLPLCAEQDAMLCPAA